MGVYAIKIGSLYKVKPYIYFLLLFLPPFYKTKKQMRTPCHPLSQAGLMEKTAAAAEPTSAAERTASPGWGEAYCDVIEIGEGDRGTVEAVGQGFS